MSARKGTHRPEKPQDIALPEGGRTASNSSIAAWIDRYEAADVGVTRASFEIHAKTGRAVSVVGANKEYVERSRPESSTLVRLRNPTACLSFSTPQIARAFRRSSSESFAETLGAGNASLRSARLPAEILTGAERARIQVDPVHGSRSTAAIAPYGRCVPSLGWCLRSTSVKPARLNRAETSSAGQR
jgi:hypothetical protein